MAQRRHPICFIAMAFGQEDTDLFYERQVLPVLRRNQIKPIIINRRQSNDDLNIQIFEQLKSADFCIADLTYARPSVYFEAGFAQRAVPVIYTVRRDHLIKGQPEDRRVHFDLQMKPLIVWNHVDDSTFAHRLEARIKSTFLTDWNRVQKNYDKYEKAEKDFQTLPTFDRLNYIRHDVILALKKLGYANWRVNRRFNIYQRSGANSVITRQDITNGFFNHVYGYKVSKKTIHIAAIQSFVSPTKTDLLEVENMYTTGYFLPQDFSDMFRDGTLVKGTVNALIVSLNGISSARIENSLIEIAPLENSRRYYHYQTYGTLWGVTINWYTEFLFLTGIKSRLQLKDELRSRVVDLADSKHYPFKNS